MKFEEKQEYQRQIDLIGPINALKYKPGAAKRLTDGYTSIRRKIDKTDRMNKTGFSSNSKNSKGAFSPGRRGENEEVEKGFSQVLEETLHTVKVNAGKSFVSPEWEIE